jgi:hypothetical protein
VGWEIGNHEFVVHGLEHPWLPTKMNWSVTLIEGVAEGVPGTAWGSDQLPPPSTGLREKLS